MRTPPKSTSGPKRVQVETKSTESRAVKPDSKPAEKPDPSEDPREQNHNFEKAMAWFHKRDFARAHEFFSKAAQGPVAEMRHAAQMHLRMCERRMADRVPELRTPEDKYNFAISLMNRGDLEQAETLLKKAIADRSSADHFHYALALCRGLKGDAHGAAEHLRRAIELQPSNRIAARNEPDFQAILHQPPLRALLGGERS